MTVDDTGAATIANGAVTGTKIASNTITNSNISSSAAIAYSKLNLNASIQDSDASGSSHFAFTNANQTFTGTNAFSNAITANGGITTSGASLGIGSSSASLALTGDYGSNLSVTDGTHTTTVGFTGTATADVTYNFDATAAAGTYDICTKAGNCTGLGGAVTTTGGTNTHLAKFTGSQTIADPSSRTTVPP